ncbi:MAG: DUF6666 family protein [Pirellulaceae bacterium]
MTTIMHRWARPLRPLACLVLSLATSMGVGAEPPTSNPLRSAPRIEKKSPPKAVPKTQASATAAVGTSVRTSGPGTRSAVTNGRPRTQLRREVSPRGVVPATYGQRIGRQPMVAEAPRLAADTSVLHGMVTAEPPAGEVVAGEVIDGGYVDGGYVEGGYVDGLAPFDDSCGMDGCGGCGNCQDCCLRLPTIPFDNLTVFGGVHGFTGPKNRGETASFGFHEGFNWGAPVPCFGDCLSMQAGARFTQSDLSGAEFSPDSRSQMFLTAGLYRRVDWGLQFGIAFDYLSDDWYTSTDLYQLRPEAAWVFPCGHELGFWFTAGMNEDSATSRVFTGPAVAVNLQEQWEATDLYAFYYRHRFSQWEGATARGYAGFTGASDGLIGADLHIPVGCDFALEAGFAYLIPEEDKGPVGAGNAEEGWNIAISLVWYPCSGRAMSRSYSSPLFQVADNGSFMVDQVR